MTSMERSFPDQTSPDSVDALKPHTRTRWADSIRAVLLEQEEQRLSKEDDFPPDVVGEQIAKLLNERPEFHRSRYAQDTSSNLCCCQNLQYVLCCLSSPSFCLSIPGRLWNLLRTMWCFLTTNPSSLCSTLKFFVGTLLLSMVLLVFLFHTSIVCLTRTGFRYLRILMVLLVDAEQLVSLCPERLVWVCLQVGAFVQTVDDWVLRGCHHAGREWNAATHLWKGGPDAESRREMLWKCPPPSARHGRRRALDPARMPTEWSADTTKHVLAINFCYVMMRDDYFRTRLRYGENLNEKQAESAARRAAFARAKATSDVVDTASPMARGLVVSPEQKSPVNSSGICDKSKGKADCASALVIPAGVKIRAKSILGELESIEIVESRPLRPRSYSDTDVTDSGRDSEEDELTASYYPIGDPYALDVLSLMTTPRRTRQESQALSGNNSVQSDTSDVELDWLDVGTRIGIRLLNSEHVQKAVASQDTAERIFDIGKKVESQFLNSPHGGGPESLEKAKQTNDSLLSASGRVLANPLESIIRPTTPSSGHLGTITTPRKPVHPLWTSPAAAFRQKSESSISSFSDDDSLSKGKFSPRISTHKRFLPGLSTSLPPRLPRQEDKKSQPTTMPASGSAKAEVDSPSKSDAGNLYENASDTKARDDISNVEQSALSVPYKRVSSAQESKTGRQLKPRSVKVDNPSAKTPTRRPNLQPGVKIVVPILPRQPGIKLMPTGRGHGSRVQMATVISSRRIHLRTTGPRQSSGTAYTNCLSVTVVLDKSFLRGGEFAKLTFRVRDEWSSRYMPLHSKFPIGACVATSYGVGVLVGWRVEDDIHVIRSLWQRRGAGSAHAYFNRDAIHGAMEASVGFDVNTNLGRGTVVAYVQAGKDFRGGRFFVQIKDEGRHKGHVLEFAGSNIQSCHGAKYIPVIELFREAAQWQLSVDTYNAVVREHAEGADGERPLSEEEVFWLSFVRGVEIVWASFLKAVEEDKEFDQGINNLFTAVIRFLEGLDDSEVKESDATPQQSGLWQEKHLLTAISERDDSIEDRDSDHSTVASSTFSQKPGFWFLNDWFGGAFQGSSGDSGVISNHAACARVSGDLRSPISYDQAFAIIRCLMRTITIARVSCDGEPNLRLVLAICHEFLLFIRTVIKVQQRNVTDQSLRVWKRALEEVVDTFGPIKDRLQRIGTGVAERLKQQGKKAKVRLLRFVDIVLADECLMAALERGEWETCLERVEMAMVKSKFIDEVSREHLHKTIMFIYNHSSSMSTDEKQAARKKFGALAKAMQWMASPRRSLLSLLRSDTILDFIERLLVRVFRHDSFASRSLAIHASNFHSLRELRMLKDFTIAGKLWLPVLNAANDELQSAVSNMPENARDLMVPVSNLFSLCVAQFEKLGAGDLTTDWLDFLVEDNAVELINEIDMKLILAVAAVCKDIKEVMTVLPYYPSIDDDILNLIDEVDLEHFLKEASDAIVDADLFADFVREKATVAVERFLDYLPKMSIPVERRELSDSWILSCHGERGGDLTLSDVIIKRENLSCQVLGGETMFFPMFGHRDEQGLDSPRTALSSSFDHSANNASRFETSILDHVRELLEQAHQEGCWELGVGGIEKPPSDRYVASVLRGIPVTQILNRAIELWRNLEIDDDELLEIVIREVSYQIQLHNEQQNGFVSNDTSTTLSDSKARRRLLPSSSSKLHVRRRFNPRVDPTVLFFEMKKVTFCLERFHFRIEKLNRLTVFDPTFEGQGTVQVRNISMKLRVECRKEQITKFGSTMTVPILHLHELDISLEKVKFQVKDTGADWILNQAVKGFTDKITEAVEVNLKEQVQDQISVALEHLNSYFAVNPDLLLGLLGITMADLEDNIVSL